MREIKAITRALGNARDTDVQIAFLASYVHEHPSINEVSVGISYLSEMLHERRKQLQADVLSALESLEENRTIADLSASLRFMRYFRKENDKKAGTPPELKRMAADKIHHVLDELLAYDAVVKNPDDALGHHKVRIATKKLRYTLEVYRPLYPDQLKPVIRNLKRLQELLGEIHDCDVWANTLAKVISDQYKPGLDQKKDSTPIHPIEPVLVGILLDRKKQRDITYQELNAVWEMCHANDVWHSLKTEIDTAGTTTPKKATIPGISRAERSIAPVHALATSFPEGKGHAQQVTRLALMLFDELAPLHRYSKKERFLLECAGLLHDIGWAFGQKGHHTKSYYMILNDQTLPLTERKRNIVALVTRYHRKTVPAMDHDVYAALKNRDRKMVGALAALLRIADGLEYTHSNRISALSCSIRPGEVICTLESEGEFHVERTRAIQKSDLFEQIFERKLRIP